MQDEIEETKHEEDHTVRNAVGATAALAGVVGAGVVAARTGIFENVLPGSTAAVTGAIESVGNAISGATEGASNAVDNIVENSGNRVVSPNPELNPAEPEITDPYQAG